MAKNFGTNPRRKLYQNLSIVVVILIFVAIMSSFTLSWFMDESTTSNGEPNITLIGDLDMDVTTNFKFKNLALAPDTVYTSDQDNTDIATYIKTSAKHNIDGAYVRIKFETERKNVGTSEYVNNLDLLKLYFDGNLTTSTNYSDESTKNKWFYNASDDYYYYLGGVYETNVMFNAGYKTSNRMINDFASAQVTIDFTVDCIQRQYGASEAVWATAPQVFKDMVSTESNITHVVNRMPIVIDGVSNYYNVETGYTVEEILKVTGLNNTITNSNSCGWYADPECTIPLDPDDIVTSSTKFYTKKATTEKLNITTDSSGKKTVTAINESITGEVVIPNDVEVIGTRAFNNVSISSIVIPESVTTIERLAISASSLTSLYIPKSVTSIASYMGSPSTLESIVVASENPKYTSGGGANCIIEKSTKILQVGCKNTTIPADSSIVTSIGKYAFRYCGSISKLHIPANITSITQGFSIGCRYITITVDSANPVFEEIDGALVNTQTKTLVYLPMTASLPESAKIENIANYSLSGTRTIHITKYIKTYNGIQEDNKLSAITCSSENEYLYATNNCLIEKSTGKLLKTSNSNFKVPDGVKSIQSNCFYANTYTSPIIIPSSCTTISSTSFNYSNSSSGDEKLKIYIPSTCANISAEAFTNTNVEIYTDVASASAKPSGWNSKMIASTSSAVWHYGTTLSQFKTLTGYTD